MIAFSRQQWLVRIECGWPTCYSVLQCVDVDGSNDDRSVKESVAAGLHIDLQEYEDLDHSPMVDAGIAGNRVR